MALLTIIPEAYNAVRQIFGLNELQVRGGYEWALGWIQANGQQMSVVSGFPLDRENTAAATFTEAMLHAWRPKHLLLVDIGGAVKGRDEVQLGDVVVHTHLHYYDYKKESDEGEDSLRHVAHAPPSARLRELSRRLIMRNDNIWSDMIHVPRPKEGRPKVLQGEMLVGGTLFANSQRLEVLLKNYKKVLAVEMEGIGVARAVHDWSVRGEVPEFLIVRGMSDYCNTPRAENQSDRDLWKCYAAGAAAAHAFALVSEMTSPRVRENETSFRFPNREDPLDNLWQSEHTNLTGRDNDFNNLMALFSGTFPPDAVARRHVICGEAGMGKSVLARHVLEQAGQQYQLRWWIDSADEMKIRSGLRELARQLGIPSAHMEVRSEGEEEIEAHRYLHDLREYFDSDRLTGRALIVLDNVDDPFLKRSLQPTVLRYLPPRTCDVLITSQSRRWHPIAETTLLRGLTLEMGAKLIGNESGRPELILDEDVQEIGNMFGGRPLFLKQVAAMLRDGDEPAAFRAQLANAPELALYALPEIEGFDSLWRTTYTMAVDRAERSRLGARQVLELLSCWAAEPIPSWLLTTVKLDDPKLASIEAILNTLVDRSMIELQVESNHRSYSVHRVVGALVRTLSDEQKTLPRALSLAATATLKAIPCRDQLRHPENQHLMIGLAPHIWALMDHTRRFIPFGIHSETVKTVVECASMLATHLWTMSEWVALEAAYGTSVHLSEHINDLGGAALRKILLANVLRQRGQFQRAEDLVSKAMPDLKRFGDPCDYAWGITAEARILRHRPDSAPQQALARLNDALPILESSERRNEPAIIRLRSEVHGYISVLRRQLSNLNEAEEESKKGLRLLLADRNPEEVLHAESLPEDYLLATHLRALAGVWRLRGDFRRATLAHERVLEIFEGIYRREHVDICRALDSLGRAQREWGDPEAALQTFERAGTSNEKLYGAWHANVGTAAVNRALTYLELNQPSRAYEEATRGLDIYRVAYLEPEDNLLLKNEATVWALFVRADALTALGKLDRAIQDHESVLAWRLARQRPGHAHQASSYFALAEALWRRDADASLCLILAHHRQALRIREEVFGPAPNFWIAQSQARVGQLTGNRDLLQQAYECFRDQLRPGHWRTRAVTAAIDVLTQ